MTIVAYSGLPGHGKSYGVIENVVKPALEQKREIWTNIPMNLDCCMKQFQFLPKQFEIDDIVNDPNWWIQTLTPGSIIVIDEVWRIWPAGLKSNNVRLEDKAFLAEHRHIVGEDGHSTEVILITQDLSQIASFARSLVETTFKATKLSAMGLDNRYRVDVYHGSVTGSSPPIAKRIREIQGKFKPEIYALYKSHTKSLTGSAGDESRMDGRFNVLGKMSIKIGFVVFILCLVLAYYGISNLLGKYGVADSAILEKSSVSLNSQPSKKLKKTIVSSREKVFKFLSKAETITIIYNNGLYPRIEYFYRIVIDDHETVFSSSDMASLNYEIYPVNECMVKIRGLDFNGFAMCEREKKRDNWVEKMVTANSM